MKQTKLEKKIKLSVQQTSTRNPILLTPADVLVEVLALIEQA